MLAEGIALGWMLIVLGAVLFLVEVYQPGFFIAVPATVLIILGVLLLLGVDILSSPTGLIVGVLAAIAAASVTVWVYSRLTSGKKPPTTLSRDSLVGLEGTVVAPVDAVTLAGKVRIGSMEWSARSGPGEIIPAGRRVVVVHSEGVHVVVKEVV
ncbi:NfeD family protein [Methanoculleus sp. 10]|uniref:NfeD family protein n=1 Tax=Methanoculleus sp. 10 TaxID=430615 RepID=UPI0025EDE94D|nr:NfeD family protein [Methanoculleus sp. 10]